MSVFKNETERLEYDYKCKVGIHHELSQDEYKNFVEWLAVRASAPNSDYATDTKDTTKSVCTFCEGTGEDIWNECICRECHGTGEAD